MTSTRGAGHKEPFTRVVMMFSDALFVFYRECDFLNVHDVIISCFGVNTSGLHNTASFR